MASLEEIREERMRKLTILRDAGMDPYPAGSVRSEQISRVEKDFCALERKGAALVLAGRVLSLRRQGGLAFLHISDGTGVFQVMVKKDEVREGLFRLFVDTVDIGDFLEFRGTLFLTKRKEKTLLARRWRMLAKSLRPLPDKWAGLRDTEERFRKRYLDLLSSEESAERFRARSRIVAALRRFLEDDGYMEVETAMLQPHAGGATALPFVTHHNALDIDLYLRIAPELYLKRLLVGGFPKVFEIGRNFRNEGIDATHNPEFTMLEFYESFADARTMMKKTERMVRAAAKASGRDVSADGEKIVFTRSFPVISYGELFERFAGIRGAVSLEKKDVARAAESLGVAVGEGDSREKILDNIYKKACRPRLIEPVFIVDFPKDMLPLAKRKEGEKDIADAFQLVIGGIEIAKGFSELNDPIDQRERFAAQEKMKREGDAEAQGTDTDFLEAMEYGMPPAGGVGIGIERLSMLLTNVRNIREVILFPTLRPRE